MDELRTLWFWYHWSTAACIHLEAAAAALQLPRWHMPVHVATVALLKHEQAELDFLSLYSGSMTIKFHCNDGTTYPPSTQIYSHSWHAALRVDLLSNMFEVAWHHSFLIIWNGHYNWSNVIDARVLTAIGMCMVNIPSKWQHAIAVLCLQSFASL